MPQQGLNWEKYVSRPLRRNYSDNHNLSDLDGWHTTRQLESIRPPKKHWKGSSAASIYSEGVKVAWREFVKTAFWNIKVVYVFIWFIKIFCVLNVFFSERKVSFGWGIVWGYYCSRCVPKFFRSKSFFFVLQAAYMRDIFVLSDIYSVCNEIWLDNLTPSSVSTRFLL